MLTFRKNYFFLALLIFIIEVIIALYIHDRIIRPYIGDVLVVILIYCFIKAFFNVKVVPAALGILVFAFLVEILQYFNFISLIGLQNNTLAKVIIGNSFAWLDMLMYIIGIVIVLIAEHYNRANPTNVIR